VKKLSVLALLLFSQITLSDVTTDSSQSTQSNTSGSNTSISGSYESESNTTYESGSSSNTTSNNDTTNNSNQKTAANTSSAPSMSVYSQSSCVIPLSLGMTTIGFSFSAGNYYVDENCERRRKSELLSKLGMKVAAISLMCQDENVFLAMAHAGTWCPHEGNIGQKAQEGWINERKKELSSQTIKPSMTWNE